MQMMQKLRAKVVAAAGTGLGVSYAFLGFNLGGKKEPGIEELENSDPLTVRYRYARLHHSRRDLQQAEEDYHETLKLANDMLKSGEITEEKHITARTMVYDGMADIALQNGKLEMAETLYKESMKGLLQLGKSQDDNSIVEMSLKLASIYTLQGKKEEAEEGYKFCIFCQTPKMAEREKQWIDMDLKKKRKMKAEVEKFALEAQEQDTAVLLGMVLGSYGRFLLYEKRYQESWPMLERARLYAKNTLGVDTDQYLITLNDVCTLFIVTQNFEKAEEALKEGIDIGTKAELGHTAVLLCNLGAVYLRQGQITQALKQCNEGRECAIKYDHNLAQRNAESCLKKIKEVQAQKAKEAASGKS